MATSTNCILPPPISGRGGRPGVTDRMCARLRDGAARLALLLALWRAHDGWPQPFRPGGGDCDDGDHAQGLGKAM